MRRGLLANRDELQALGDRIYAAPFDAFYHALRTRCNLILSSALATEMNWQGAWANGRTRAALVAARGAQGRIFDLLVAHYIDDNPAYRDRAKEELLNLIQWSTWIDPSHRKAPVDLCTAECAVAAAVGLDWLWDDLSQDQRESIISVLKQRVILPYLEAVDNDIWWYTAVNHWNAVINAGCGLAAMALGDDDPDAQRVFELSQKGLDHFFDDLGNQGGWDEGIGYWGYAIRYVVLFGEACARQFDDQKIFHHRGMAATGRFPICFSPNGHAVSFGDQVTVPLHGALYLLPKYFDIPEFTWWLDTYAFHHDVSSFGWSSAGLSLLFRPEGPTPQACHLDPVMTFDQIGWASMADNWPRPDFYVAAKTGDLAASHSQHDMNSIQLMVDREMLLCDLGHPPEGTEYFSDARARFYEVQAQAHNTILIGGEDHMPDAQGSILDSSVGDSWRWIACDAGDACGENKKFIRNVVMLVDPSSQTGHSLVVVDELRLHTPELVTMLWHVDGKVNWDSSSRLGQILGRRSGLHFTFGASFDYEVIANQHPLEHGCVDRYLRLTGPGQGRVFLVSVFSRNSVSAPEELQLSKDGALRLDVAGAKLVFRPDSRNHHLQLAEVVDGAAEH